MPPVSITPRVMEEGARALFAAKGQGSLADARFREIHAAFIAADAGGTRWTIELPTQHWNRLERDQWVPASPPPELFLDSEVVFALEALKPAVAAGSSSVAPPPSQAADRSEPSPAQPSVPAITGRTAGAPGAYEKDWGPVFLSLAFAAFFAATAFVKASALGLAVAVLFALLVVILTFWN